MSGSIARFFLSFGVLSALLGISSAAQAERPRAWRGNSLLQLTASREALSPGSSRNWGLSYPVDETYAGPWASSPLAPTVPHAPTRSFVTFERNLERNPGSGPGGPVSAADASARQTESVLSRLGPVGMLASVLIPAVMGSAGGSGRATHGNLAPRLGFAKLGRGYGFVLTGRFY
jgi:hypothetical protein